MAFLTITKLGNGNVEITGRTQAYTFLPTMNVFRDKSAIDGVTLLSNGKAVDSIRAKDVLAVGSLTAPITGDELYEELKENFFSW